MIINQVEIINNAIKCRDEGYPLTVEQCQDCAYHQSIEDNKVLCSYLTPKEYEVILNDNC